jgi:hypothetical protein
MSDESRHSAVHCYLSCKQYPLGGEMMISVVVVNAAAHDDEPSALCLCMLNVKAIS